MKFIIQNTLAYMADNKMKRLTKKGVLQNFEELMQGLATVVIIMVIVFLIIAQAKTEVIAQDPCTNTSHSYNSTGNFCSPSGNQTGMVAPSATLNATNQVQGAMADIPTWLKLIIIVAIGGLLLTLVRFLKKRN